ncbi:hypothetical protein Tco_0618762 [Tanacetum coccineum]
MLVLTTKPVFDVFVYFGVMGKIGDVAPLLHDGSTVPGALRQDGVRENSPKEGQVIMGSRGLGCGGRDRIVVLRADDGVGGDGMVRIMAVVAANNSGSDGEMYAVDVVTRRW